MDTQRARELLDQRRRDLHQVIRTAEEQAELDDSRRVGNGEQPSYDTHAGDVADVATDTVERELGLSVRESAQASLEAVELAEKRLTAGTYGVCPVCEEPIPEGRLEAKPEAEFCVKHQPKALPLET
jgi:RNA polymerase-binding transcription factor DksA